MSGSLIIIVLAAVCISHVASQNLHWQERTPRGDLKPPARRYSALAWTPISLYLFGGEGEDGVLGMNSKHSHASNYFRKTSS